MSASALPTSPITISPPPHVPLPVTSTSTTTLSSTQQKHADVWSPHITPLLSQGFDGIGIYTLEDGKCIYQCGVIKRSIIKKTPYARRNNETSTSPWNIYPDEIRAIIIGISNTNTIMLQRSTEEEAELVAAQREACQQHLIPDLVSYVIEYVKEGPAFDQALGSSGVLIDGYMYLYIRGIPLDYIIGKRDSSGVIIYRTTSHLIIGTSCDVILLSNLCVKMGNVVDRVKKLGL